MKNNEAANIHEINDDDDGVLFQFYYFSSISSSHFPVRVY